MLKVDKNIPIPLPRGKRTSIYPFKEMEVGDSFLVPSSEIEERRRIARSVYSSAHKHRPSRFVVRHTNEGIRVWKVE